MKKLSFIAILFMCAATIGCSKLTEPAKNISLGNRLIDYQEDNQVDSLIIPPDLTTLFVKGASTDEIDSLSQDALL